MVLYYWYINWMISKMVHPTPFGNSLTSLWKITILVGKSSMAILHNSASLQEGTVFYHVLSKTYTFPKFKWHI